MTSLRHEVRRALTGLDPEQGSLHDVAAHLAAAGFMGVRGTGGDAVWQHVALAEEIGGLWPTGFGLSFLVHAELVLTLVARHGSPEAQGRFLAPALVGDVLFSRAVSVVEAGAAMTAEPRSSGYVVRGEVRAVNAAIADVHCVVAEVGPSCDRVAMLVPGDLAGVEARLGPDVPSATVRCDDAFVPEWCVLGAPGVDVFGEASAEEDVLVACHATAVADRYLREAFAHSHRRQSFGSALYGHQGVRLGLAELRAQVEGSRCLNHAAMRGWEEGDDFRVPAAAARLKAVRLVRRSAEECAALHGAAGYVSSHPVARFVRDARLLSAAHGSDEAALGTLARLGGDGGE